MNVSRVVSITSRAHIVPVLRRTRRASIALVIALLLVPAARLEAQGPPPGAGRPVVLEGDLDVLYEDNDAQSRVHYFLDTIPEQGRRRVQLRFNGDGPDLPSGSRVRVTGDLADDGTVTSPSVTTIVASAARTLGEQTVLVILFNFSNNAAQPYTPGSIDGVNTQVRDLVYEHSYRQTILSFAVTGWHTIAASNATCDYSNWATMADEAATKAGFNIAAYARRVYAFPQTSACAWWGMGNVGGPRSYVNGTYTTRVVAHEQGHNFGNRHSHALKCDAAGCVNVDYGDDRDVMGAGGVLGHTNAFQKERLGWLNYGSSPVIQTATASGDYWIDNYASFAGNNKGLKIWNAAAGNYYYFEARERVGFDANVPPGVTLHTGSPSSSDSSFQLDLDPAGTAYDSTLDVGQTVDDTALGVSFTTLSSNLDGALIRVSFNAAACATAAPGVSLSPGTLSGAAGSTLSYSMTVTNRNSATCAASPFTFAASVPNGWTASFNPASVASLAPGAGVTTTLALTSPSTASGSSTFTASARDGSTQLAASVTGTATLTAPTAVCAAAAPAVALSPSTQSGAPGSTLSYSMTVTNKNSSACAASAYTFAASAASGWSASFNPASASSLASGASVTTTLSLTSPTSASGSNAFSVSATDGTSKLSASASGTASIAVNLSVTAAAVVTKTGNTRTASLTVTVKNGSAAVPKASVTATVTLPGGATDTVSGTTDAAGVATLKYSPKPKDPAGTYSAKVVASASGATATATTSFVMP